MSKKPHVDKVAKPSHEEYKATLHSLQVELVKLQRHFIKHDDRILVLLEGRDSAGKDGLIKRIVRHLSPRETRIVALGKPSDRDDGAWYFQRYVPHLPVAGEFALFNRSWYNRAGVERVMGFCSADQCEEFLETVPSFEHMLVRSGIKLLKYYLDISKHEQKQRLDARRDDVLKRWKLSPIDEKAVDHWDDYSQARDEMLSRTSDAIVPWTVVRADHKHATRLAVIKDVLSRLQYHGKDESLLRADPDITFRYAPEYLENGMVAA
ncbi:MAG: polyphosphate kinase 2 [Kofleriaceae bacterium]